MDPSNCKQRWWPGTLRASVLAVSCIAETPVFVLTQTNPTDPGHECARNALPARVSGR